MSLSSILKNHRKELGLTLAQIADKMGVAEATVQRWESGAIKTLRYDKIGPLAEILHVTPSALMGWEVDAPSPIPPGFEPMPEMVTVPLIGSIACGEPITAEENIEDYVAVPAYWHATFTLRCRGDSMEPTVHDGDLVAIRKGAEIVNSQIYAVRIDDEATLKHVYLYPDRLELRPENPAHESRILFGEQMSTAVIEGKAVGFCRNL